MEANPENQVYGDVCVRKQRRKRQRLLVIQLLFDYAQNSTLHGLRYIVSHGLSIVEKLFWFITFATSIVLCFCCVSNLYSKWKTSPVIVTINERQTSVGTVPFPAVTICPQIKVKLNEYNYTEQSIKYKNKSLTEKDLVKYLHIRSMCDDAPNCSNVTLGLEFTNVSLIDDITQVAPTLDDLFFDCEWYEYEVNCQNLLRKVYTEHGICYTTNTLATRDIFVNSIQSDYPYLLSNDSIKGWSQDIGYNYSFEHPYPRRGRVLGSFPDLEIILKHSSENNGCNQIFTGFKIFLQHPADFPQSSLYYYAALPNQLTSLAVNFNQFATDSALSKYPAKIRQCYFPEERKLRYFKTYTAKNCQAECLSNYAYLLCGCVGFYMPHDNSSQLCSVDKGDCIVDAKDRMALEEINAELGLQKLACHCLPACNTVEYDAEILKTEFNLKDYLKDKEQIDENLAYSKIDIYFKKPQFLAMQRRELFGLLDLLANIGGLMGLFLGFSFLSLIEIFYFLTMRVGFILKRDLEEEKARRLKNIDLERASLYY